MNVSDRTLLNHDSRTAVVPLYSWGSVAFDGDEILNEVEPVLSIGMLLAQARAVDGGRLNSTYQFVRIRPDARDLLTAWENDPQPSIFLFSDYIWNIEQHLAWSARVKELSPESLCIHGGPSCPKYVADAEAFFRDNPSIDVAVRGEAELIFCEILDALGGRTDVEALERLTGVAGLTVRIRRGGSEDIVRTEDAERPTDLDALPSPYLTGEFDDLLGVPWRSASIETNRGCPYGCTFCDWGSATLSRIRKFDLDRVRAELDWVMEHARPPDLMVTDANFGILKRDLEVAEHIAQLRSTHDLPYTITISGMAKNTVKYSVPIINTLVDAGIGPIAAQSVQSTDTHTLEVIRRSNIKLEKFDEMAEAFVENGLPLVTDILMGLPGSTVESFKNDLQDCFDREVTARTMEILLLPNSPMNDPEYRAEHKVECNEFGVVCSAATFTRDDYAQMRRIRLLYRALDHFGLMRYLLRYLQWERGLRAVDVIHDIDRAVTEDPERYPLLAFVARAFDVYTIPPDGWAPFFDEVQSFLTATYGLEPDDVLATVIELQRFLLPARGRSFPAEIELRHDWMSYHLAARAALRDGSPIRPLDSYGPAVVRVSDPTGVTERYLKRNAILGPRENTTSNLFWVGFDWELNWPLMRHLVTNIASEELSPA